MKKITREELDQILQQHQLWLDNNGDKGERAVFNSANLSNTSFRGANLRLANLSGANLIGADLSYTDLRRANLRGADLQGANLYDTNLIGANLSGADLRRAGLDGADFDGANLRDAQFSTNIRDCYSFCSAQFTSDVLPWLILHPRWAELRDTVQIEPAPE
jgi:uncharacterized protein YjbI with pentapeptide repeats